MAFLAIDAAAADPQAAAPPERDWCAAVGVSGPVELRSRTLVEIPDVTDESIRRLNLQLSIGCFREVRQSLARRLERDPDNPQLRYVLSRFVWMTSGSHATGEAAITDLVARFPDFVSGRVLFAGLRIAQERYEEASAILDSLGPETGDWLWVYMGRLRVRAGLRTDEQAVDQLFEVATNDSAPPNARDTAFYTVRRMRYNDPDFQIPLYRSRLDYRSTLPFACRLQAYAYLLVDRFGRYVEAIEAVEPYLDRPDACSDGHDARVVLGFAHLMLAADVAARPAPANRSHVDRADELLADGGYEKLANFLLRRPERQVLEPFLFAKLDPNATDQHGRTRICNAVLSMDARAVETELARGADPNGKCGDLPLVVQLAGIQLLYSHTAQEQVLRLLLQYGARYENFDHCNPAVVEGCTFYLYPIFQEYGID